MQKKKKTQIHDLFIREVRVSYVSTENELFRIRDSEDVASFVRSILTENSREHFVAMYLNGSHHVASYSTISIGTANSTLVHRVRSAADRCRILAESPRRRYFADEIGRSVLI